MSAAPPLGEPTAPLQRTYTIDTDPATVAVITRDLGARERVQFWSTFESTVAIPNPSRVTGEIVDDVAAVFAGSKPATIVSPEDLDDPLIIELFAGEKERYQVLAKAGARDYYGGQRYFIGKEENVKTLAELYYERGGDDSPRPANEDFHRSVGRALGYSSEAIESFVAQISSSRERAWRKGKIGRALSKLSLKS